LRQIITAERASVKPCGALRRKPHVRGQSSHLTYTCSRLRPFRAHPASPWRKVRLRLPCPTDGGAIQVMPAKNSGTITSWTIRAFL
jgi:hypothetical protein